MHPLKWELIETLHGAKLLLGKTSPSNNKDFTEGRSNIVSLSDKIRDNQRELEDALALEVSREDAYHDADARKLLRFLKIRGWLASMMSWLIDRFL